MILALIVGVLFAGSVYLMLQRDRLRVILGFILLGHAANLLIFSAGGTSRRGEPLGSGLDPTTTADPLPQAFVLTAIVIAFAITIFLLVLAVTGRSDEDAGTDGDDRASPSDEDGSLEAPADSGSTDDNQEGGMR